MVPPPQRGLVRPEYEVVVLDDGDRLFQLELRPGRLAGLRRLGVQQAHAGDRLARARVDGDEHVVPDGPRGIFDHAQADVHRGRRREPAGRREHVAAADLLVGDAAQVGGHAAAGQGALDGLPVRLEVPDASLAAAGRQRHLLPDVEDAVDECAGHDGAEPGDRERAVDVQPGASQVPPGLGVGQDLIDGGGQLRQALPRLAGYREHPRAFEGGALEDVLDVGDDQLEPVVVDQVLLGDDGEPAVDSQQVDDRQVLAGLRHHRLVGGDYEQCEVYAADSGQHVVDEPLVAGNVDDADLVAAGQAHPGEAQVDGHAPLLLLAETVGVDPGQCLNKGGLAVVDVPGCANDEQGTRPSSPDWLQRITPLRICSIPFRFAPLQSGWWNILPENGTPGVPRIVSEVEHRGASGHRSTIRMWVLSERWASPCVVVWCGE